MVRHLPLFASDYRLSPRTSTATSVVEPFTSRLSHSCFMSLNRTAFGGLHP